MCSPGLTWGWGKRGKGKLWAAGHAFSLEIDGREGETVPPAGKEAVRQNSGI